MPTARAPKAQGFYCQRLVQISYPMPTPKGTKVPTATENRVAKSIAKKQEFIKLKLSPEETKLVLEVRKHGADRVRQALDGISPEPQFDGFFLLEGMPATQAGPAPVWHLPNTAEGLAYALFDVHAAFHDSALLSYAIDQARRRGVKLIILGGDFADCYAISRFTRDPGRINAKAELEIVSRVIESIRRHLGDGVEIIYLEGNHELRYHRWLIEKGAELYGLIPDFKQQVGLDRLGVQWVDGRDGVNLGGLYIEHGHHIPSGGSVDPARLSGLKIMHNSMSGHIHRSSTFEPQSLHTGEPVFRRYTVGCMCGPQDYAPRNAWSKGFARIQYTPDSFEVENVRLEGRREVIVRK